MSQTQQQSYELPGGCRWGVASYYDKEHMCSVIEYWFTDDWMDNTATAYHRCSIPVTFEQRSIWPVTLHLIDLDRRKETR